MKRYKLKYEVTLNTNKGIFDIYRHSYIINYDNVQKVVRRGKSIDFKIDHLWSMKPFGSTIISIAAVSTPSKSIELFLKDIVIEDSVI